MIYVISAVGTEYVKIGIAKNPIKRMNDLQIGVPMLLVLIAVADWPHAMEKRIHRVLADHRVRGEWFANCDKIASMINHMQRGVSADIWIATLLPPSRLAKVLAIKP